MKGLRWPRRHGSTGATVDFLRPIGAPRVGWWLLALGIAALAVAFGAEQRWTTQRAAAVRAAQDALALQQAAIEPLPARPPTPAQRRWQQVQPELQRPWLPALRAIESATVNPVFLLSMTIEPVTGLVKLDAEAPSFDHALAFVQVLDLSGALRPASLVSHEQSSGGPAGRGAVRFSAMTRWVDSAAPSAEAVIPEDK